MITNRKALGRLFTAGVFMAAAAVCSAQTTNTVVAEFGTPPGAGSEFTINLLNKGEQGTVAGFAFRLHYNPEQVAITGVTNNTGQPSASVQYTLGDVAVADDGTANRILSATTMQNLENASELVQIKLQKQPGFTPPLYFQVTDRVTEPIVDGLQNGDLNNIPHTFDTSAVNR